MCSCTYTFFLLHVDLITRSYLQCIGTVLYNCTEWILFDMHRYTDMHVAGPFHMYFYFVCRGCFLCNFSFFIHAHRYICASVDVRAGPALQLLQASHLHQALSSSSGMQGMNLMYMYIRHGPQVIYMYMYVYSMCTVFTSEHGVEFMSLGSIFNACLDQLPNRQYNWYTLIVCVHVFTCILFAGL